MNKKFNFGVTCQYLKDNFDINLYCLNENEVMSVAAGAILAGKIPTVYIEINRLSSIVNIIKNLYQLYGMPFPKLVLIENKKSSCYDFLKEVTSDILKILNYTNVEIQNECK